MAPWYSKERLTLSARWKLLAVSASVVVLIALLCGQCESSTRAVCMNTITAIASSLSLIEAKTSAPQNNSEMDTTSLKTIRLTTTTLETSSNAYADTSLRKFAIFIAANMATKTSDLTIMPVSSTAHLTINSSINKSKALLPLRAKLYKIFGRMGSAPSANLTSRPRVIPRATYLKKSRDRGPLILICATTNTALPSGLNRLTSQCLLVTPAKPVIKNHAKIRQAA